MKLKDDLYYYYYTNTNLSHRVKDKTRTPLIHSAKFPSALTYRKLAVISHYLRLGVENSMLGVLKNQIPLSGRIREHFAHGFYLNTKHARVGFGDNRKNAFTQFLKRSYCQQRYKERGKKIQGHILSLRLK